MKPPPPIGRKRSTIRKGARNWWRRAVYGIVAAALAGFVGVVFFYALLHTKSDEMARRIAELKDVSEAPLLPPLMAKFFPGKEYRYAGSQLGGVSYIDGKPAMTLIVMHDSFQLLITPPHCVSYAAMEHELGKPLVEDLKHAEFVRSASVPGKHYGVNVLFAGLDTHPTDCPATWGALASGFSQAVYWKNHPHPPPQ